MSLDDQPPLSEYGEFMAENEASEIKKMFQEAGGLA